MPADLLDVERLFLHGQIGAVELGLDQSGLLAILKEPEGEKALKGGSLIQKFGDLQLVFRNGHLESLQILLSENGISLPKSLSVDLSALSSDTTPYELLDILDSLSVPWNVDNRHTFDRQLCVVTGVGCRVFFDFDRRCLTKIALASKDA